jgi:phage regulator Rha-like protein
MDNSPINILNIQKRIFTIREVQVMIDVDLAEIYGVETRILNQAVKRNQNRFPLEFRFQLNEEETKFLKSQSQISKENPLTSQNVTLKDERGKHRKYLPYAFTEQGVAMLSAVLRSNTAVKVSIQIIKAFVDMKKFISSNAGLFQRLDIIDKKLIESDTKFDIIFNAIENKSIKADHRIFFDGQIFDAYTFVSDLIRSAEKSIVLIDNYIDDSVLILFSKRKSQVSLNIYTKTISKELALDLKKHNEQYQPVKINVFKSSHDRFLIIDEKQVYHFGASLKDLGKKWFAFSKFDIEAFDILNRLGR